MLFAEKLLFLCILNKKIYEETRIFNRCRHVGGKRIQDFRGNDGLWENYPVEQIATHEGWEADPTLVTNFYNMLRKKLYAAKPNEGHKLIKELENNFEVTVITQNVDNLHEKAGSSHVIHLHGELSKVCSAQNPYDPRYIQELPEDNCEIKPAHWLETEVCCDPSLSFFGESVPMIEPAAKAVQQADIFVIIGTSLNVYPAAGLISYTKPNIPIYLIDPALSARTDTTRLSIS